MGKIDEIDRRILTELQRDAGQSLEALSETVALSRNACWRRIKRLEDEKVISGRVALLDPEALSVGQMVFVALRTDRHDPDWQEVFTRTVRDIPEIIGVYRTAGDLDYLLKIRVRDVKDYDALYQRLIRRVSLSDVSAIFVMEEIKETTALPVRAS